MRVILYTHKSTKPWIKHNRDQINDIKSLLEIKEIEYEEKNKPFEQELRDCATQMRITREKLMGKNTKPEWNFNNLVNSPILVVTEPTLVVYPWWYLKNEDNLNKIIWNIQQQKKAKETLKQRNKAHIQVKIKNKLKKSDKINISLESQARINVTMLRLVNGADIYSIMKGWGEKEKAAALITWRLAQHNKANDLRLMAEMMENRAKDADPYVNRQTNRT